MMVIASTSDAGGSARCNKGGEEAERRALQTAERCHTDPMNRSTVYGFVALLGLLFVSWVMVRSEPLPREGRCLATDHRDEGVLARCRRCSSRSVTLISARARLTCAKLLPNVVLQLLGSRTSPEVAVLLAQTQVPPAAALLPQTKLWKFSRWY
jgi:hypothetical protein